MPETHRVYICGRKNFQKFTPGVQQSAVESYWSFGLTCTPQNIYVRARRTAPYR